MLSNKDFWGKQLKKDKDKIYNKKLIFFNFMSLFIPDFIYLIQYLIQYLRQYFMPYLMRNMIPYPTHVNRYQINSDDLYVDSVPTLSCVTMNPISRAIHVAFWYYGYFYRMKILTTGNGYYNYFYYGQLITWLCINAFPISHDGGTPVDYIHYISACINFNLFALMKIFYCKDSFSFTLLFLNLMDGFINEKHSKAAIFERLCMYHVILTRPSI